MPRYVAFLRGINVSGQKLIKMEELRKHFELPGFENIVSYIQSGNVLFDAIEKKPQLLRKKIEQELENKLGYAVLVLIRSVSEIKRVIKNNPFTGEDMDGKGRLYVSFLSAAPSPEAKNIVESFSNELEQLKLINQEAYLLTASFGSTRFSNTFIEKKLGLQSTVRNWNTVNKILEL